MPLRDLLGLQYLQHFLGSPSTVVAFLAFGLMAVVAALGARRRRLLVLATGIAAAAVGALTLPPARGWTTLSLLPQPLQAVRSALRPHLDDLGFWASADGPANVALFVPLALCLGLLLARPGRALILSVLLSALVESYQAATGTRVGAFADVVSNGVGAVIGALLSAVVLVWGSLPWSSYTADLRSRGDGPVRGVGQVLPGDQPPAAQRLERERVRHHM